MYAVMYISTLFTRYERELNRFATRREATAAAKVMRERYASKEKRVRYTVRKVGR